MRVRDTTLGLTITQEILPEVHQAANNSDPTGSDEGTFATRLSQIGEWYGSVGLCSHGLKTK